MSGMHSGTPVSPARRGTWVECEPVGNVGVPITPPRRGTWVECVVVAQRSWTIDRLSFGVRHGGWS